jgi:hypothetical protein
VSHSGLALAGSLLQGTDLGKRANRLRLGDRKRPEVSHGDVLTAMIGLLCVGKPDFEAIEAFREDEFFRQALGLKKVPSEGTLRQRLDELEHRCDALLREESAAMVARHAPKLTPCYEEWVALDIDPSPFDNSGTKKEGVSWTYRTFDGYNPWFAYLGNEGYLVHCQLREGRKHCPDGMPQFLDETIAYARQITAAGQRLLLPEIEIATFWTSLKLPAKQVIALYHQHGTREQFHSEIKSDMDLERLPSGKFATNALVLSLGQVAYNVLRLCGETSLQQNGQLPTQQQMPLRKPVVRRRLRSVIQDLMYLAARWTYHSHRWGLSFWRNNPWHGIWQRLYQRFTRRACPVTS